MLIVDGLKFRAKILSLCTFSSPTPLHRQRDRLYGVSLYMAHRILRHSSRETIQGPSVALHIITRHNNSLQCIKFSEIEHVHRLGDQTL